MIKNIIKILILLKILTISNIVFAYTVVGNPPSCTSSDVPFYSIPDYNWSSYSIGDLYNHAENHVTEQYPKEVDNPQQGSSLTNVNTVTTIQNIYKKEVNFTNNYIEIRITEHRQVTNTYTDGHTSQSETTYNRTFTYYLNKTCTEQPQCQEDFPNQLNITRSYKITGQINSSGLQEGYMCFTDSKGSQCGFKIPDSETYKEQGRNGDEIKAILHNRGGRNGGKKVLGNPTGAECEAQFLSDNPFTNQYAVLPLEIDPPLTPNTRNGETITHELENGSKVDILLPVSDFNSDGTCSNTNDNSTCLTIFEANSGGLDYVAIKSTETPPATAYVDSVSVLTSTADVNNPDIETVDLYQNPLINPAIKNQHDNKSDTQTTSSASAVIAGGSYIGTGENPTGTGTGTGGDGGGDTGGTGGTGTGTGTENITCGGTTGISCESTQAQVLDKLTKMNNALDVTLSGGSDDCTTKPTCEGRAVSCATALSEWRFNCMMNNPTTETKASIDNDMKTLAQENGVLFDGDGKAIIPTETIDVSNIIDQSGYAVTGSNEPVTLNISNKQYQADFDPILRMFQALGVFVLLSVGIYIFKTL